MKLKLYTILLSTIVAVGCSSIFASELPGSPNNYIFGSMLTRMYSPFKTLIPYNLTYMPGLGSESYVASLLNSPYQTCHKKVSKEWLVENLKLYLLTGGY